MKSEVVIIIGITAIISYIILRKPRPNKKGLIQPIIDLKEEYTYIPEKTISKPSIRGHSNPYEVHGFGIDIKRNVDDYEIDTYLDLPLVGSAKTYSNERLAEIDYENRNDKPIQYKYLRLNVKETRDATNTVSVGAIEFYNGSEKVNNSISIWDPHSGDRSIYKGNWTNNQTRSLNLFFHSPCPITSYRIKTSNMNPSHDPSIWSLEGSINASYWITLHNEDTDLPEKRGEFSDIYLLTDS